jgi:CRISPR-associated protein Cas2
MSGERSFYLLAYDITSDKRRAKIARLMESLGERVQGSVFEAYLTPAELDKLVRKAKRVLNEDEDSLRVYFLCSACRQKITAHGAGRVTPPPGVMVV